MIIELIWLSLNRCISLKYFKTNVHTANSVSTSWKCISVIFDGEEFLMNGLNIWEHKWESTGKTVKVKDPKYKASFKADIYIIHYNQTFLEFAAVEFSNSV